MYNFSFLSISEFSEINSNCSRPTETYFECIFNSKCSNYIFNTFDLETKILSTTQPLIIFELKQCTLIESSRLSQVPQIFDVSNLTNSSEYWRPNLGIYAEALTEDGTVSNSCGRVNIMGTIVQDAAPYLFPFIIEYSLIGAAVIYVMWKHIGRHPRWPHQAEADLERRLEAMLSRRAVALAHAGICIYLPVFFFFFKSRKYR